MCVLHVRVIFEPINNSSGIRTQCKCRRLLLPREMSPVVTNYKTEMNTSTRGVIWPCNAERNECGGGRHGTQHTRRTTREEKGKKKRRKKKKMGEKKWRERERKEKRTQGGREKVPRKTKH